MVESTDDLIWTCTPDGKCGFFNRRWIDYTGIPAAQQFGYEWLNQVHPDDRQRLMTAWNATVERNQRFDIEFRIRSKDGSWRWFKARAVAARDVEDRVVKWFGTSTNIEDLGNSEEGLRAANNELESFNYAIAHDLRGPVRHIHGFAELLTMEASDALNETARGHLNVICESTERMGLLLGELLELSRLGRLELRKSPCNLNSLVAEIVQQLKPEAVGREIEWRIANLPNVECDATLIKQAFTNLISNAIKFTRRRSPAVIEIGQMIRKGVPVILVRDNGEGFDMRYADQLYRIFHRLHRKEDFEGTGVGLAIVRRIIDWHHGTIWAEAELNRGATFYFNL